VSDPPAGGGGAGLCLDRDRITIQRERHASPLQIPSHAPRRAGLRPAPTAERNATHPRAGMRARGGSCRWKVRRWKVPPHPAGSVRGPTPTGDGAVAWSGDSGGRLTTRWRAGMGARGGSCRWKVRRWKVPPHPAGSVWGPTPTGDGTVAWSGDSGGRPTTRWRAGVGARALQQNGSQSA